MNTVKTMKQTRKNLVVVVVVGLLSIATSGKETMAFTCTPFAPVVSRWRQGFGAPSSLLPIASGSLASSATSDNESSSSSSLDTVENDVSSYTVDEEKAKESLIQVALVGVAAFAIYNIGAAALASVSDAATGVFSISNDDALRLMGNLANMMLQLIGAVLQVIWQAVPVVGKAVVGGIQVAAPIVGKAGQAFGEVASPIIQEASKQLEEAATQYIEIMSQAAAPYVDSVTSAVDATIVAPVQYAVGDLQAATDSVVSVVDSTIQSASALAGDAMDSSMKSATESVANSIKDLHPFGN